jgi:hypothetical protein
MIGVGAAAPAALSGSATIAGISLVFSTIILIAAAIWALVGVVMGLSAMFQHGANVDGIPTLMNIVPLTAVLGILILRQNHGLHEHFDGHATAGSDLRLLTVLLSIQLVFLGLGLAVMLRHSYFSRYVTGPETSASVYGLVCPGVGLAVIVQFWINKALVGADLIAKFSTAYWGPPKRIGIPQPALSVDLGPATNVLSMRFETNHLAPISVSGRVADARTGTTQPVFALPPMRPPLVPMPAWLMNQPNVRARLLPSGTEGGFVGAMVRAQGMVDTANDGVVTASGEVDVARYGRLLRPRAVVGVRGAGFTHDGLYFVKSVTHKISRGQYRQDFTLTREGDGSLTPVLPT